MTPVRCRLSLATAKTRVDNIRVRGIVTVVLARGGEEFVYWPPVSCAAPSLFAAGFRQPMQPIAVSRIFNETLSFAASQQTRVNYPSHAVAA